MEEATSRKEAASCSKGVDVATKSQANSEKTQESAPEEKVPKVKPTKETAKEKSINGKRNTMQSKK